jgi:lipopolysaccharide transport system ATP-binding protein
MSDTAMRVEHISKGYRIGPTYQRNLQEMMGGFVTGLLRKQCLTSTRSTEIFHALQDITFEINKGEVVGIIGRNGSGKSTLLKILSRITKPDSGRALIYGGVASLLEIGVGFHPELTGRENIYLSGSIIGMQQAEVKRKLDEIIDFSGCEQFIDTPIKRYSSGMGVRLGFAVAAHLEADILLVDEVLAVGDLEFQKKCLNKMQDIGKEGRTVLFVSHNMAAITRLCPRAILLDAGKVIADGPSPDIVPTYMNAGSRTMAACEWTDLSQAPGGEVMRLVAVRVRTEDGEIAETVDIRKSCTIEMEYEVLQPGYVSIPSYNIHNEEGILIFGTLDLHPEWRRRPRPAGRWTSTVCIPGNFLAEGRFFITASVATMHPWVMQFCERDAVAFQVVDSMDGDSARGDYGGTFEGVVRPLLKWRTTQRDAEAVMRSSRHHQSQVTASYL